MARTKIKTQSKTKTNTDESFHPYSINVAVKTKEELDELIRLCKEMGYSTPFTTTTSRTHRSR